MDLALILLGALALIKGTVSVSDSLRYRIKILAALKQATFNYLPKVTVIVPCKEVDPEFEENISAVMNQKYDNFSMVFVTGTPNDSAYSSLEKIKLVSRNSNIRLVTAGLARKCSQKIHNLLRGIEEVEESMEVLVFADSDIRPHTTWLRSLVAPLNDENVGASTGYRWYNPIKGNIWSALRSIWNMTSANLLFSDEHNFAWGGSMAIRKKTFEELHIAQKWQNGLSDDMILTRAVKDGGYKIKFVPQSIVASIEKTSFNELIEWTSRQMTIVRIYDPRLWKLAAYPQWVFNLIFIFGLILVFKGLINRTAIPFAAWLMLSDLPLGALINFVRYSSFKIAMPHYQDQIKPFWWVYVALHLGASFVMSLSFINSRRTNRITWHGIHYEMRSPEKTVVLNL